MADEKRAGWKLGEGGEWTLAMRHSEIELRAVEGGVFVEMHYERTGLMSAEAFLAMQRLPLLSLPVADEPADRLHARVSELLRERDALRARFANLTDTLMTALGLEHWPGDIGIVKAIKALRAEAVAPFDREAYRRELVARALGSGRDGRGAVSEADDALALLDGPAEAPDYAPSTDEGRGFKAGYTAAQRDEERRLREAKAEVERALQSVLSATTCWAANISQDQETKVGKAHLADATKALCGLVERLKAGGS